MLRLGFFDRLGSRRGYLFLARDLQGWRKDDVFRLPQLRKSFNPSLIESFFPDLSVVSTERGEDLCSKSILGLSYVDVIAILLSPIPLLFGFSFVLLSLYFGFFSLFLKFLSLL